MRHVHAGSDRKVCRIRRPADGQIAAGVNCQGGRDGVCRSRGATAAGITRLPASAKKTAVEQARSIRGYLANEGEIYKRRVGTSGAERRPCDRKGWIPC